MAEQGTAAVRLTPRELQCLALAGEGLTAAEISARLQVAERTVIFHLANAQDALGASNRLQAVARAVALGLVRPSLPASAG